MIIELLLLQFCFGSESPLDITYKAISTSEGLGSKHFRLLSYIVSALVGIELLSLT